ncbi:MAG: RNA polymerase factor sigma-54 [Deltaproteobacteria bacterium]|nr:RNA polymerase factor sigma-54 [Deltaproteobacteria bacterium]
MAIELRQSLKLSQQLVITPQLQQAIKLLQLSRLELAELVEEALLENPTLEETTPAEDDEVPKDVEQELEAESPPDKSHEGEPEVGTKEGELKEPKEFDWENYIGTYNAPGEETRSFAPDELPSYENFITKPATLQDHLEWQLRMAPISEHEEEIGLALINALDENGYLTTSLEELAGQNGSSAEEVEKLLTVIQEFDPLGVGARDLKECLLLQARPFREERPLIEAIIRDHLHLLEKRDYPTIARKLKVSPAKVASAAAIIHAMEPKPGRPYGGENPQYITPDLYVYKVGDNYEVVLNEEGLPRLQISRFYRSMISGNGDPKGAENSSGAKGYVQDKLKSALWLIKSIHQRQRTLYRVAKCIVKFQRDFLEKGINHLRPMILKEVADEIGMHESTVSRATNNKFIHTPQGIFELKFFFNSRVASSNGEDLASETVKEKIRRIVEGENARHPLSDKNIADTLSAAHIHVARRTVAKYREVLGILPSSRRRQLY